MLTTLTNLVAIAMMIDEAIVLEITIIIKCIGLRCLNYVHRYYLYALYPLTTSIKNQSITKNSCVLLQ